MSLSEVIPQVVKFAGSITNSAIYDTRKVFSTIAESIGRFAPVVLDQKTFAEISITSV